MTLTCENCGAEYEPAKRNQRFCSAICRKAADNLRRKLRRSANPKRGLDGENQPLALDPTPEERRIMGVRQRKPGMVTCLRCGRRFRSKDTSTNRICARCRDRNKIFLAEGWLHLEVYR